MNIEDILKHKKTLYLILWLVLFVFSILFFSTGIGNECLSRNEGFTYAVTNNSFKDIIKITQYDYNPPLYFIMIKLYSIVFGNSIIALRIFSLIGTLALMGLSLGPVKRIIGKTGSIVFMLLLIILPAFSSASQDAQLYSWACFFVTASVLYGCLIITGNKISDWIKFGVLISASSFIHYYALVAVTLLNIFIFIFFLIKDRKKIIAFIILDLILVSLFLPWIPSLFYQTLQVIKRFWIVKPDFFLIMQSLTIQFGKSVNYAGFALLVVLLYYAFRISFIEKNKQSIIFILSLFVYISTFVIVFLFSKLIKPVLYPSYFVIASGLIALIIAYTLSKLKETKTIIVVLSFLLIITIPSVISIRTVQYNKPVNEALVYLQLNMKDGDVLLHADDQTAAVFLYYFPSNNQYLNLPYYFKGYMNYNVFKKNLTVSYDVNRFLLESKNVWIVTKNKNSIPYNFYRKIVYNNKYKLSDNPELFTDRNSWITIELLKFEKIK